MRKLTAETYFGLLRALLVSNALSLLLLAARMLSTGSTRFWYMTWNLLLAWLPVMFAYFCTKRHVAKGKLGLGVVLLAILWLGFLPNSFYLLSDLIHLRPTGQISVLYDAVMLGSFIFNGFIAGYMSVYIMHKHLLRFSQEMVAAVLICVVFLLCGFAVYLGRTLRWNSWDVLLNPAGILFDVSDGIINPFEHPQIILTTTTFFLITGSFYFVLYEAIKFIQGRPLVTQK